VIWPEKYDAKTSTIYALNDIDVKARPQAVWRLLVDGENWSSALTSSSSARSNILRPKVAKVGVGPTAYGRRSKSGETPDGAADLRVA
jgi:hypothetical protein